MASRHLLLSIAMVFGLTRGLCAQDAQPLTVEAGLRVAKLLEEFDPNSYSLTVSVKSDSGKVSTVRLGKAVGLGSLTQSAVERDFAAATAGTNVNNNIFKVAGTNVNNNIFRIASTNVNNNVFKVAATNVNNNIFRVASTNVNNNIFVNDQQAAAARELNALFEMATADEAPGSAPLKTKPIPAEHAVRIGKLLEEFDPNTFSLDVDFLDSNGSVSRERFGKAVGLGNLTQTSLERDFAAATAGTNVNNNIFKVAGTNVNNNIFRIASTNVNNNVFKVAATNVNNNIFRVASTNVNNNIFVNDQQAAAARELNALLQKAVEK